MLVLIPTEYFVNYKVRFICYRGKKSEPSCIVPNNLKVPNLSLNSLFKRETDELPIRSIAKALISHFRGTFIYFFLYSERR